MAYDWGGAASGGISGAGTGFSIGGVPGAIVGGLFGGAMGLFNGDEEPTIEDYESLSPEQLAIREDIIRQIGPLNQEGMQYLNQILSNDPSAFAAFEAPIKRQYQEETIPAILERFSGAGARSSSALDQTLAKSGERLSENLSAQRANLRNSALGYLQNYNQIAQQPTKQAYTRGGKQGYGSSVAPNVGENSKDLFNYLRTQFGMDSPGGITGGTGSYGGQRKSVLPGAY